jgi:hypothetical protein
MDKIRVTYAIDARLNHDCDRIHLDSYSMQEVILPATKKDKSRKAIQIVIRGRNLKAVAQPLMIFVGDIPVQFLRMSADERSVEGILLQEPKEGAHVDVILGDEDHARHPIAFSAEIIKKIN